MLKDPQKTEALVTFTREIFNRRLNFCAVIFTAKYCIFN